MAFLRPWTLGLALALLGLGLEAQVVTPVEGIRLDIPADWEPVLCKGRLHVFSSEGRNQILSPGDDAPQCDPVHFSPALQPVCGPEGPLALDREGNLWQLGPGLPRTIQAGLKDAVGLWADASGPTILFRSRLVRPNGQPVTLPFEALGGNPLPDGGAWVWGASQAARVGPAGDVRWDWKPPSGAPGPAALDSGTIFAGTSSGFLIFLRDTDGKERFAYRGGGATPSPPVISGGLVIWSSSDHFVRAVRIKDGQLAWQFRGLGRPVFGPFPVTAGLLVAESGGNRLIILEPATGKDLWTWSLPSGAMLKAPAASGETAAVLAWDESSTPLLFSLKLPLKLPLKVPIKEAPSKSQKQGSAP